MKIEQSIIDHAVNQIKDGIVNDCCGCELADKLFNEDYFIIGYYNARKWLESGPGVFEALQLIKEYEEEHLGEVTIDFSDEEKVANMFAYIQGTELINSLVSVLENWDEELNQEKIDLIISELESE